MMWSLLLNRYVLGSILIVAFAWAAYAAIHKRGYDKAMAEVAARDAKAERQHLALLIKREDVSDEARAEMRASLTKYGKARDIQYTVVMERTRANLPVYPVVCRAPSDIVRDINQAIDAANKG